MISGDAGGGAIELRARRGDPAAFGALLREYDGDLRGVAWSVVRSPDAVDDDSFIQNRSCADIAADVLDVLGTVSEFPEPPAA